MSSINYNMLTSYNGDMNLQTFTLTKKHFITKIIMVNEQSKNLALISLHNHTPLPCPGVT